MRRVGERASDKKAPQSDKEELKKTVSVPLWHAGDTGACPSFLFLFFSIFAVERLPLTAFAAFRVTKPHEQWLAKNGSRSQHVGN